LRSKFYFLLRALNSTYKGKKFPRSGSEQLGGRQKRPKSGTSLACSIAKAMAGQPQSKKRFLNKADLMGKLFSGPQLARCEQACQCADESRACKGNNA